MNTKAPAEYDAIFLLKAKIKGFIQKNLPFMTNILRFALPPFLILGRQGKIKKYLKSHEIKKLQIGTGNHPVCRLKGWLNSDINGLGEIYLDALQTYPFQNEILDYIYCEQVIEHLPFNNVDQMLKECRRVLKPGGKLRIATPDLKFYIDFYYQKNDERKNQYMECVKPRALYHAVTTKESYVINNIFYGWDHRFIYDFKTLEERLLQAGYSEIKKCYLGKSDDANLDKLELHPDDAFEIFPESVLVVEAKK